MLTVRLVGTKSFARSPSKESDPLNKMKQSDFPPFDLKKLDAKLRQWQKRHDTPAKVAEAHRKVLLDRVVQSMAFENEPVSMARLKTLLKNRKKT